MNSGYIKDFLQFMSEFSCVMGWLGGVREVGLFKHLIGVGVALVDGAG